VGGSIMKKYELTGDNNKDFIALTELLTQAEREESDNSSDIQSDCNKKLMSVLPNTDRDLIREKMFTSSLGANFLTDIILEYWLLVSDTEHTSSRQRTAKKKSWIDMFEDYEKFIEGLNLFDDESDTKRYCYFENEQEERLGRAEILREHPNAEIVRIAFPIGKVYFYHGGFLFEHGRNEEAKEKLLKAVKYQPGKSGIYYELAETYKRGESDMELFHKWTLAGYRTAWKPAQIARAYRDAAYYFSEMRQWQLAYDAIMISSRYQDDKEHINNELEYIRQYADIPLAELTPEEEARFCEATGMIRMNDE